MMASLQHLFRVAVLLSFGLIPETLASPDDRCQFIFKEDHVLQVAESENAGAKVRTDLHTENKIKCAEACCESEGEWCTFAVYHFQANPEAMNCFLVQCIPDGSQEDVCITKHVRHSDFTAITVKHHIPTPNPQTTESPKVPTSKATAKPATKASMNLADSTLSPKWTSPVSQSTNQKPQSNTSQPINATQSGPEGSNDQGEVIPDNINRTTVTQTSILIVTLCFGIIFLLAMIVVSGKRWCEGYQRRKYSKVDYLINGYYS
nr:uncharacterized protein C11orf24-like [Lytechinus pictus]